METPKFEAIDHTGKKVVHRALFSLNYIVYTDDEKDRDGSIKVYASKYETIKGKVILKPIDTDEEFAIIEKYLDEFEENSQDIETEEEL